MYMSGNYARFGQGQELIAFPTLPLCILHSLELLAMNTDLMEHEIHSNFPCHSQPLY